MNGAGPERWGFERAVVALCVGRNHGIGLHTDGEQGAPEISGVELWFCLE